MSLHKGRKRSIQYQGWNYYLGGVQSVLGKIQAMYGVNTKAAQEAVAHVKASMRDKYYRTKKK